jgi:calcineurin-like phosphoesterase family protein
MKIYDINNEIQNKKIWIISDTHFFHGNIIKYCDRPFYSYQEMNKYMINKWNSVVSKEDIVIHLGDFAFRNKAREIRDKLNGTIFLIRGNHDLNITDTDGFLIIDGKLVIGNIIFTHHPLLKEEIPIGYVNIHGHIHDKDSFYGINVSVEKINYTPISIEKYLKA